MLRFGVFDVVVYLMLWCTRCCGVFDVVCHNMRVNF